MQHPRPPLPISRHPVCPFPCPGIVRIDFKKNNSIKDSAHVDTKRPSPQRDGQSTPGYVLEWAESITQMGISHVPTGMCNRQQAIAYVGRKELNLMDIPRLAPV